MSREKKIEEARAFVSSQFEDRYPLRVEIPAILFKGKRPKPGQPIYLDPDGFNRPAKSQKEAQNNFTIGTAEAERERENGPRL